jgi:hypothetical protein
MGEKACDFDSALDRNSKHLMKFRDQAVKSLKPGGGLINTWLRSWCRESFSDLL